MISSRQHSIGMGNIIKFVRYAISQVPPEIHETEAKSRIINALINYMEERIIISRNFISNTVCYNAIQDDDVICIYSHSVFIQQILLEAKSRGKCFKVIVVDSRPLMDGRKMIEVLSHHGIDCIYTLLHGVSFIMKDATRVLLGASAVCSNGTVLAIAGTAMIAAIAKANRIPVMFAAESYKFTHKVQLDSIVFNELGNTAELIVPSVNAMINNGAKDDNGEVGVGSSGGSSSELVGGSGSGCVGVMLEPQTDGVYRGTATDESNSQIPFSVIHLRYEFGVLCVS